MPELAEAPAQTASPFGTNLGDMLGQTLRAGMSEARAETAETPAVEQRAETQTEQPENQQRAETQVQTEAKPREEHQQTTEQTTDKKDGKDTKEAKIDGRTGKPQIRFSELKLGEERDILTAEDGRRLEAFRKLTAEKEEAAKAKADLEAEVATLRQKAAERDELNDKYGKLNESYSEQQKRLASVDVTRTDEYQEKVAKPYIEEVAQPLKELAARFTNFNLALADKALRENDAVTLAAIRKSLPDEDDRTEFRALEMRARGLVKLHGQYVADAPKAYKEITERKTAAEKQAIENDRAEVAKSLDAARKANAARFAFLDPASKDAPPELKAHLESLDAKIRDFDFNALKPNERAGFIEAAHKGFVAANVIDGIATHLGDELQKRDATIKEKDAKIAELEGRLAKRDSTSFTPGRTGVDARIETPTEYKGDAAGLLGSLLTDARKGK